MTNPRFSVVMAISFGMGLAACQPKSAAPSSAPASVATAVSAEAAPSAPGSAIVHVVCPVAATGVNCRYQGGAGIQAAIDAAANGDTIMIKAGRYSAAAYRDVPYKIHLIRGFAVVDGKDLTIQGEPGTVLDGGTGVKTTAFVLRRSRAELRQLELTGFRFDVEEDEIYEGHGIFAIDSRVRLNDITIEKYQKMALAGRGDSLLEASNLRILDGHVAIWLQESASLRLSNALIRGNDSAGIAAYDNAVAHVANTVFDGNLDDALYTEHEAAIYASNTLLLRNKPYAARALGHSHIWIGYSGLFGNAAVALAKDQAMIRRGPNLIEADPRVDAEYRLQAQSPLAGKGDPDVAMQQFGPI